jgi:imidazole glycerol-phosphate synthase subunit HisH
MSVKKSKKVVVLDYGIGNVLSVSRAIKKLDYDVVISSDFTVLSQASHLILPGVGAFGRAVGELRSRNLEGRIINHVNAGKPLLGICVGMQLLMTMGKEFGDFNGINLISGTVEHMQDYFPSQMKLPHIGWSTVSQTAHSLVSTQKSQRPMMYFVHSYMAVPKSDEDVYSRVNYQGCSIVSEIGRENIYGTQFHPEKSGDAGLRYLNNFCALDA